MKVISLQSGSNGNCFYLESGDIRLLFDAGISAQCAAKRLAEHDRDIKDVDALFISHDHSDHVRAMGVFQRRFDLPVFITRSTLMAANRNGNLGAVERINHFRSGDSIRFGSDCTTDNGNGLSDPTESQKLFSFAAPQELQPVEPRYFESKSESLVVHTIPTPHDSADGVVFVVENSKGQRIGILTDLGHVFKGLKDVLRSLDAVIIESNYDTKMLEYGRYPARLKRRISGRGGHISNLESANLVKQAKGNRLKWACLCHLSQDNNSPEVALDTHKKIVGSDFPIHIARRDGATIILEV